MKDDPVKYCMTIKGGYKMSKLAEKKCIPCSVGTPPMEEEEINKYQKELKNDWEVVDNNK